jgi:hypothetical protein
MLATAIPVATVVAAATTATVMVIRIVRNRVPGELIEPTRPSIRA